jgi:hypothetical protein
MSDPDPGSVLRRNTRPAGDPTPFSAIDVAYWLDRKDDDPSLTDTELAHARLAWDWLTIALGAMFPNGRPRRTPFLTGLDLIWRSLPYPQGAGPGEAAQYVCVPDPERATIRDTSTQHRFEVFGGRPARLRVYDCRVAYLAACDNVPVLHQPGDLLHDDGGTFDPGRRGFYRLDVTVPADWKGPGLVHAGRFIGHTHYPSQPGATFAAWCESGDVYRLHRDGWPCAIRERILGAVGPRSAGGAGGTKPLSQWAAKLRTLVEHAEQRIAPGQIVRRASVLDLAMPAVADVYRAYLRRLTLVTIGELHSRAKYDTATYPSLDDAPPPAPGTVPRPLPDGRVELQTPRPFPPWRRKWEHPEWSAAIYATSRARALKWARELPPGALVAIDGDAIYVDAAYDPGHPDDGRVGRFRLKSEVAFARPLRLAPGDSIGELRERITAAEQREAA